MANFSPHHPLLVYEVCQKLHRVAQSYNTSDNHDIQALLFANSWKQISTIYLRQLSTTILGNYLQPVSYTHLTLPTILLV